MSGEVVTIRTACFNVTKLYIVSTERAYVYGTVFEMSKLSKYWSLW
jgi:hypothetical protein